MTVSPDGLLLQLQGETMTDIRDQQLTSDTSIREYIRALLRHDLVNEEARQERIRGYEKSERRIIDGGQTGQDTWEITDWRTGEFIAAGTTGITGYDAAAQQHDPDHKWLHIDQIEEASANEVEHAGLPVSLADALQDWLGMSSTSDEDIAAVVGWSVEEVSRHRECA